MSIWLHAMSYLRPSSEVDFVRPVIACLVAVYGAEFGLGEWADMELVVDYPSTARLLVLHDLDRLLCAEKRSGEIGAHDRRPLIEGHILQRNRWSSETRVVEQKIHPSERIHGPGEQDLHRIRVADIGGDAEHSRPELRPLRRRRLQRFLAATSHDDRVSSPGETKCHGPSDAGAPTCDDGDFGQTTHRAVLLLLAIVRSDTDSRTRTRAIVRAIVQLGLLAARLSCRVLA